MAVRRAAAGILGLLALLASTTPGVAPPARADEHYALASDAVYEIRPAEGEVGVTVGLSFTNSTPNPAGRFSVFSELRLAIHDGATQVAASDDEGALEVSVAVESDVNVATIELRDEVRFEDTADLELAYTLPDTDDPQLRVRPSLVVFPAWSFGTSGEVAVTIPSGYELRVDGDPLTEEGDRLTSGPIDDPGAWLALVTAVSSPDYTDFTANVALDGGTADVLVRAFSDDEAWGTRTLDLVERALGPIETEIGLPYPRIGQLVLTEVVPTDSSGLAEGAAGGTEFMVAFDQPDFTVLHQVTHAWLSPALIEARWIREGLASHVAARVAPDLEVSPPYDPAAEAEEAADAAFPLDAWPGAGDAYGYPASWAVMDELETLVGADALRAVLVRVAAGVGPYESREIESPPAVEPGAAPVVPLTSRGFLDHLETVGEAEVSELFATRVLTEGDVALLETRAEAREQFDDLVAASDGWGAPDPVRGAMVSWSFEDALADIDEADAWLAQRDDLLDEMQEVGLSAPDRLQQSYLAHGGGPEAVDELEAEAAVVAAYASTADSVNAERSFAERVGLLGGPDPQAQLTLSSGRFADGDLRGALDAISETRRILAAAETGGVVRLVALVLLVVVLVTAAVILFRRRASYTPAA